MSQQQALPPTSRTALWAGVTEGARRGEFVLPVCNACQTVQYPPREICMQCLNHELQWQAIDPYGELIALSQLNASTEAFFREHLPWSIGMVKLDCGPLLYAHLSSSVGQKGDRVRVLSKLDKSGHAVLIALADKAKEDDCVDEFSMLLK